VSEAAEVVVRAVFPPFFPDDLTSSDFNDLANVPVSELYETLYRKYSRQRSDGMP
jgi:predicted transcriptional regulator